MANNFLINAFKQNFGRGLYFRIIFMVRNLGRVCVYIVVYEYVSGQVCLIVDGITKFVTVRWFRYGPLPRDRYHADGYRVPAADD